MTKYIKLKLQDIKDRSIWVIKYIGHRSTCTGLELDDRLKDAEDIRDYYVAYWEGQPEDLQPFWKAYDYANYVLREDLFYVDDFYNEWIKDPNRFIPEHRKVIGTLFDIIQQFNPEDDLLIVNYDSMTIGNHKVSNFIETLSILDMDFDVVEIDDSYEGSKKIIIQEDNLDLLKSLEEKSNKISFDNAMKL